MSLLLHFLKIGNNITCPPCFHVLFFVVVVVVFVMIKWYLRDTIMLWEPQSALKKLCVCVCIQKILYLFASQFLFLGKSDYLNPIMHSSPLFFLSLCIPLPPVNQKKVVSQAIVESEVCCFLISILLCGTLKSWVNPSHEVSYLFQLQKIYDLGALRYDHFQFFDY